MYATIDFQKKVASVSEKKKTKKESAQWSNKISFYLSKRSRREAALTLKKKGAAMN